jgi:spore coat polysaccharide biosynthesis protein SpsF|tara:strand:- start:983 stop:1726 length:744 start_codon:yes stop_codon:yes gene_type:complete
MIGCIVQARMGSSRLPGKVLLDIDNKPVLSYLIGQLKFSKKIEKIVIATTNLSEDDKIVNVAKNNEISYFRGNDSNVLDRFYNCAKKFSFDVIIRITADCPLIDPEIIDKIVNQYENGNYDYVSNTIKRTFPFGTEVEVFSLIALEFAWKNAKSKLDKEHVTPFIRRDTKNRNMNFKNEENLSHLRYTLDYPEDLDVISKIILKLKKRPILLIDILNLIKKEPNVISSNKNIKVSTKHLNDLSESID